MMPPDRPQPPSPLRGCTTRTPAAVARVVDSSHWATSQSGKRIPRSIRSTVRGGVAVPPDRGSRQQHSLRRRRPPRVVRTVSLPLHGCPQELLVRLCPAFVCDAHPSQVNHGVTSDSSLASSSSARDPSLRLVRSARLPADESQDLGGHPCAGSAATPTDQSTRTPGHRIFIGPSWSVAGRCDMRRSTRPHDNSAAHSLRHNSRTAGRGRLSPGRVRSLLRGQAAWAMTRATEARMKLAARAQAVPGFDCHIW